MVVRENFPARVATSGKKNLEQSVTFLAVMEKKEPPGMKTTHHPKKLNPFLIGLCGYVSVSPLLTEESQTPPRGFTPNLGPLPPNVPPCG